MLFTSLKFILFFGIVMTGYYTVARKRQWLLLASYVFYAFASPVFLVFLVFSTAVTFVAARFLDRINAERSRYIEDNRATLTKESRNEYNRACLRRKRRIVVLDIVLTVGLLAVLKYSSFLIGDTVWLAGLFGIDFTAPSISLLLPIGLSFYTFQNLGYCIDVYRDSYRAEKNIFKFALFTSYFPQILQGPIGNYADLAPQLYGERSFEYKSSVRGIERAAWGFFKKLVIADRIAVITDTVFGAYATYHGPAVVFALLLYAVQLYADFSGYMDIALGVSEMLGVRLSENFKTPYFSTSVADFWRKWHITLGTWFRNYLFYPLLRSRMCEGIRKAFKKKNAYLANTVPTVISLFVVWFLIGLWHGADWSYVAYGLYHGMFIILATVLQPIYDWFGKVAPRVKSSKPFRLFQYVRTFLIVTGGYILFRPGDLSVTKILLGKLLEKNAIRELFLLCYLNVRELLIAVFGIAALILVDLFHLKNGDNSLRNRINAWNPYARRVAFVVAVLAILFLGAYGASASTSFLYFRF